MDVARAEQQLGLIGEIVAMAAELEAQVWLRGGWAVDFFLGEVTRVLRSATLAEDFERLKLRAVSVFEHLGEEVVEAGFARIEAALPSLGDGPQYETSELLVFQR